MNKKFVVYGIVMTLLLCVGMSYAYFSGTVGGNKKDITISSRDIRILFTDNNELASSEIIPGWKETKTFSVKNESGNTFNYNIVINDLVNTFVTEGYLQYKITSSDGYNMEGYLDIPKSNTPEDIILAYDIDIPAGVTQEYTIEFIYHDSDEDQSEDMGKIFSGTLGIVEGTINPNVKYKVTLEMENGTITSTNPAETIKNGSVKFNISLNEGYTLDNSVVVCDGNAEGSIEGTTIKIDKVVRDQTCRVTTEKINYNLTMNITGGTIKPANVMVAHGDSKEFTITASTGYTLDNPTITCTGGASHTLSGSTLTISNVKSNQTCGVVLKKAIYTVSVNVTGGSASPTSATIEHGSSRTFTIISSTGYTLEGATVSGTGCALSGSTLTVSNVTSNRTCAVILKELPKLLKNQILADHTTRPGSRPNLNSGMFTTDNTKTLYTASGQQTEGGKIVYYFAGNALDNWVYFANLYWRIIRINEDGSVRLLYVGPDKNTTNAFIGESKWATGNYNTMSDPKYVGYMYGASGSLVSNRNNNTNSLVKGVIDTWYGRNITSSYHNYVSKTAIYCNDRANENYTTSSQPLDSFYFASYKRLVDAKSPSYKCGNNASGSLYTGINGADVADKFTGSTSTGNGKLSGAPAALMTADELAFAGTEYDGYLSGYYDKNALGTSINDSEDTCAWWTMSPLAYWSYSGTGNYASIFAAGSCYSQSGLIYMGSNSELLVRPVLSLKSCVKWKSGNGTSDNPYTVDTLDSSCSTAEN